MCVYVSVCVCVYVSVCVCVCVYVSVCVCECVCVCVCLCASPCVIRHNNNPVHLQRVGRRGQSKKKRKKKEKYKSLPAPLGSIKYRTVLSLKFICLCRLSRVAIRSGFLYFSDLCLSVFRRQTCGSQYRIKLTR
jgi:hypothetical protein